MLDYCNYIKTFESTQHIFHNKFIIFDTTYIVFFDNINSHMEVREEATSPFENFKNFMNLISKKSTYTKTFAFIFRILWILLSSMVPKIALHSLGKSSWNSKGSS